MYRWDTPVSLDYRSVCSVTALMYGWDTPISLDYRSVCSVTALTHGWDTPVSLGYRSVCSVTALTHSGDTPVWLDCRWVCSLTALMYRWDTPVSLDYRWVAIWLELWCMMHPVPHRVMPSLVISDIWALWRSTYMTSVLFDVYICRRQSVNFDIRDRAVQSVVSFYSHTTTSSEMYVQRSVH